MALRFAADDITIHRIIEDESTFLPVQDLFPTLANETLTEHRDWLRSINALDNQDVTVICVQSYVVKTPHHTILVDTCVGNDKARPRPAWNMLSSDRYMRNLAATGFRVEDIDMVMCTHLHVDHVGWNTRLENGVWKPTFPNARYTFAQTEYDYWVAQNAKAAVGPFVDSVLPVVEAGRADLVSDTHAIGDHVRLIPTPGHTPGHVAIAFGKSGDAALMIGDMMHSPLQLRLPELSPKFDVDGAQAAVTRRNILERLCDSDTLCCTAHFPSPSLGRIKRRGDGFSCEAVA